MQLVDVLNKCAHKSKYSCATVAIICKKYVAWRCGCYAEKLHEPFVPVARLQITHLCVALSSAHVIVLWHD